MKAALCFFAPLLLYAQTATVEGAVVRRSTGQSLAGIRVQIADTPESTITDSAGRFRLPAVPLATKYLSATGEGWLSHTVPLDLKPGEPSATVKAEMLPAGEISGRIEDEDRYPVSSAQVKAFRYTLPQGWVDAATVFTNDLGEYRLTNLRPARYWLRILPGHAARWDPRYHATFFPSPPDSPDARALTLDLGGRLTGINIRLRKEEGREVRGRVAWPAGSDLNLNRVRLEKLESSIYSESYSIAYSGIAVPVNLSPDGSFVARHVPPGAWALTAEVRDNPNARPSQLAFRRVNVSNSDVDGIVLELKPVPHLDLRGTLTVWPGARPEEFQVMIGPSTSIVWVRPSAAGDFVVHDVQPGPHSIFVRDPDSRGQRFVRLFLGDVAAVGTRFQVPLDHASTLHVDLPGPGTHLRVSVRDASNGPVVGALVVFWDGTPAGFNWVVSVADELTADLPAPGTYHFYVAPDAAFAALLSDPVYLQAHLRESKTVTIQPGDNPLLTLRYSGK